MRQNLTNVGKVDIDAVDHFYIVGYTHRDGLLGFDNYKIDLKNYTKAPLPLPDFNGHDYVDLGLPSGILWATVNVGASSPEEIGNYYAWGETVYKGNYSWNTYAFGTQYNIRKYTSSDGKAVLDLEDDAAAINMGEEWRMPTAEEVTELISNTEKQWVTSYNGKSVSGLLLTSSVNNNSLFIRAAGSKNNAVTTGVDQYITYWCSSRDGGSSNSKANEINGGGGTTIIINNANRNLGHPVRGVISMPSETI